MTRIGANKVQFSSSTCLFLCFWFAELNESLGSNFPFRTKVQAAHRSENLIHNKEQQMHEAFYKEIGVEMLKSDHVLLFGPTNAKRELVNYIKQDLHFKDMEIDVEPVDCK